MKPIFRCEYCDKMGVEEEIAPHEETCMHNYNKKSCYTCKYAENKITKFNCTFGKSIPEGKIFEFCDFYDWDEKDHTTRNPTAFNTLFGGLFG